jgi:hypothetical protein
MYMHLHNRQIEDEARKAAILQRRRPREDADTYEPEIEAEAPRPQYGVPNTCPGRFATSAKAALEGRKKPQVAAISNAPKDEGEAASQGKHATPPKPVIYMRHILRKCLPFWKTFCKSTLVLSWIQFGFDLRWLPGKGPPQSAFFRNHRSAFENTAFVTETIADLLLAGSLELCIDRPWLVSPLGVQQGGGQQRPPYAGRR